MQQLLTSIELCAHTNLPAATSNKAVLWALWLDLEQNRNVRSTPSVALLPLHAKLSFTYHTGSF